MDVDSAATFLAGSILFGTGFVFIGIVIVTLNNIFHKYWKPVQWSIFPRWVDQPPSRFMTQEEAEKIAPTLDTNPKEKNNV